VGEAAGVRLRVLSAGRPLTVEVLGDHVQVSGGGRVLDPAAADVLMALGGAEPDWLRVVEGLEAVHRRGYGSEDGLQRAADVLGRKASERARLAKTTSDELVLVALAAGGQAQVAANPACTIETWDLVASHRSDSVRTKAREHGFVLPPALAAHPDLDVKTRVARNPACPSDTLAQLATVPADGLQAAVASNPNTEPAVLERIGRAWDSPVNQHVAGNPRTPVKTLRSLAARPDAAVRARVAANPAYPPRLARRMVWDTNGRVRFQLAGRTDLSGRALTWVERYARRDGAQQYRMTRWRLTHNPTSPPELLRHLAAIDAFVNEVRPPPPTVTFWTGVWVLVLLVSPLFLALLAVQSVAVLGVPASPLVVVVVGLAVAPCWMWAIRRLRVKYPPRPYLRPAPPTPRMIAKSLALLALIGMAVVAMASGDLAPIVGAAVWATVIAGQARRRATRTRK
jgi:hypothetical protein